MTDDQEKREQGGIEDVYIDRSPEVRIRTKKMLMYFIIFAIVMLFGGFTSATIFINSSTYRVHIVPPEVLNYSIAFLVASSLMIILAIRFAKRDNKNMAALFVAITFLGGIGFTYTQMQGWEALSEKGMGFTQKETEYGVATQWNTLEKITGEYGVDYWVEKNGIKLVRDGDDYYHPTDTMKDDPLTGDIRYLKNNSSGMIFVLIVVHIIHLALGLIYLVVNLVRVLKGSINSGNYVQLSNNGTYWHFMGLLWIYLFLFLFFIH